MAVGQSLAEATERRRQDTIDVTSRPPYRATPYARLAPASSSGVAVRGTRFPFHDKLLVSATAQLGAGLLRLGMEIPLLARLAGTVRSALGPTGAWGDAQGTDDIMTTLACAELLAGLDPGFDPHPTARGLEGGATGNAVRLVRSVAMDDVKAAETTLRAPVWAAAGLLLAAACFESNGGDAVTRSAAGAVPCPRTDLAILSRPAVGNAGTYVVEGCGQRLTYEIGAQSTRPVLVSRVALTPVR